MTAFSTGYIDDGAVSFTDIHVSSKGKLPEVFNAAVTFDGDNAFR
jgi:hypothetical protein